MSLSLTLAALVRRRGVKWSPQWADEGYEGGASLGRETMASDNVRLMCPNLKCRTVLSVPAEARGKNVRCRNCGTKVMVPASTPSGGGRVTDHVNEVPTKG